jgi:zinc ribbon protein
MFCSQCGFRTQDGAQFCENCGASLRAPGGIRQQSFSSASGMASGGNRRTSKSGDPYKEQIVQLKLQIRELKLHLKQITTNMSNIRSQYNETAAFVPRGMLRWGDKAIEDFRLLGPQQQKQQLQQQIMQLDQQLLGLQQAQAQWKAQQQQ